MRKKILSATFVIAMAAIAGYNTFVNQTKVEMSDMALANVEALADGGEGTPASYCYLRMKYSTMIAWKKFCNEQTNATTIYPCPQNDDYDYYSESAQDRCTN